MKVLKNLGYNPIVIETFNWRKEPCYYAEVHELKAWISLSSPGDMSDIPIKKTLKKISNQLSLPLKS